MLCFCQKMAETENLGRNPKIMSKFILLLAEKTPQGDLETWLSSDVAFMLRGDNSHECQLALLK